MLLKPPPLKAQNGAACPQSEATPLPDGAVLCSLYSILFPWPLAYFFTNITLCCHCFRVSLTTDSDSSNFVLSQNCFSYSNSLALPYTF